MSSKDHGDPGDKNIGKTAGTEHLEGNAETSKVRLAEKGAVDAAQRANPNRSRGSLAAEQEHSIELFHKQPDGSESKTSRHNPLTENQLAGKKESWQDILTADFDALKKAIGVFARGEFELKGSVHEMPSPGAAVVEQFRSMLTDKRRNDGEFQWSVGLKDNKHYSSPRYYEPKIYDHGGFEVHLSPMAAFMQSRGCAPETVLHTHPLRTDKASNEFSSTDKSQADYLQQQEPKLTVRSYLLTPDNIVKAYVSKERDKHPNGTVVGHFDSLGNFVLTDKSYESVFKGAKFDH